MIKKIIAVILAAGFMLTLGACGGGKKKNEIIPGYSSSLDYPENGRADASSDSWLQIDDIDEEVEITWFIDSTRISIIPYLTKLVSEKFNISINWRLATSDDGMELSSMIAGNKLPDIITISDYTTRVQLAEREHAYPLQVLAQLYAPSMLGRIPEDMAEYYAASNGYMYGWPNNYCSDEELEMMEETGRSMMAAGAVIVREDYLEEYIKAFPEKENGAMKPSEFIEMCKWVQDRFSLPADNPTVCLEPKNGDSVDGTRAITTLNEMFCVAPENADGTFAYKQASENYKEVLLFLNEMYREKLITSGNLTANFSTVQGYIQQGLPYAIIGYPQDFNTNLRSLKQNKGIEYVPIVLTNSKGEVPQIKTTASRGLRYTMITKNCKRVDRVIKLFDYLVSEEGQRTLYFGEEGTDYVWEIKPGGKKTTEVVDPVSGETVTKEITYKYGQIKWTDSSWTSLKNQTFVADGIRIYSMLQNPLYPVLAGADGQGMGLNLEKEYIAYNQEACYTPYTYSQMPFLLTYDIEDEDYDDMLNIETALNEHWSTESSKVIIATTPALALKKYEEALATAEKIGYKEMTAFKDKYYRQNKKKMGITYGYPKNDPASSYHSLRVTSLFGDRRYNLEIPSQLL